MTELDEPKTFKEKYFLEMRNNFSGSGQRLRLKQPVDKWTIFFLVQLFGLGIFAAFIYDLQFGVNAYLLSVSAIACWVDIALLHQLRAKWYEEHDLTIK